MLTLMGNSTRRLGAALTIIGALALAGCATGTTAEQDVTPPPAATPTVQPEDDLAACAIVGETLQPTLDIVTAMVDDPTGQSVDAAEVSRVADELKALLVLTTAKMDAYAAPYASAVILLDDMFEGRTSGSQSVDTGAYRDATIDILAYCVDEVGYSANQ